MDIAQIRRENLLLLFSEFIAAECPKNPTGTTKGLDGLFAAKIQVHNTYFSGMKKGARGIGDKLARQIEANTGMKKGWLDEVHDTRSKDLERFLALAERAWRVADKPARERMRTVLKEVAQE
jgi:hypothetical protein